MYTEETTENKEVIEKLNLWIRQLEHWNTNKDHEDKEDIEIHLIYNDLREYKQKLLKEVIDAF